MLRFLLFAVCLLGGVRGAVAQNWATVQVADTAWFTATIHPPVAGQPTADTTILRALWIVDVQPTGSDTAFSFFRGIRAPDPNTCIDTAASSWLGPSVTRRADGREIYYNSFGDSIVIHPNAPLHATWVIGRDTAGNRFEGTIGSASVIMIDGVPDSVKTLFIQAFSGTTAIPHEYNSLVLQWSKSHGWTKALDFYSFPNTIGEGWVGTLANRSQHIRLPKTFGNLDLDSVNILAKYTPGNEWTWSEKSGNSIVGFIYTSGHDSVIAAAPWGTSVIATVRRRTIINGQYTDVTRVDTFQNTISAPRILREHILPDFKDRPMQAIQIIPVPYFGHGHDLGRQFYVNRLCGGELYRIADRQRYGMMGLAYDGNCYQLAESVAGIQGYWHQDVVPGFGVVYSESQSMPSTWPQSRWNVVAYFRMGSCTMGIKEAVVPLEINSLKGGTRGIPTLGPNPAASIVYVSDLDETIRHAIILRDATGRVVQSFQTTGRTAAISTATLPAGLYFVEVSNATNRTVLKLLVVH